MSPGASTGREVKRQTSCPCCNCKCWGQCCSSSQCKGLSCEGVRVRVRVRAPKHCEGPCLHMKLPQASPERSSTQHIRNALSTSKSHSLGPISAQALHPLHLQGTQMVQDSIQAVFVDSDSTERCLKRATVQESRACSLSFPGLNSGPLLLRLKQPVVDSFRL